MWTLTMKISSYIYRWLWTSPLNYMIVYMDLFWKCHCVKNNFVLWVSTQINIFGLLVIHNNFRPKNFYRMQNLNFSLNVHLSLYISIFIYTCFYLYVTVISYCGWMCQDSKFMNPLEINFCNYSENIYHTLNTERVAENSNAISYPCCFLPYVFMLHIKVWENGNFLYLYLYIVTDH